MGNLISKSISASEQCVDVIVPHPSSAHEFINHRTPFKSEDKLPTTPNDQKEKNRKKAKELLEKRNARKEGVRVLCMDGGGMRGLIEVETLKHLSSELYGDPTGVELLNQFDLICGTSVGGLLALALAQGHSLDSCQKIMELLGSKIFNSPAGKIISGASGALKGNLYSTSDVERYLKELFGVEPISESIERKVFVVTTKTTKSIPKTVLFRSYPLTDHYSSGFEPKDESPALFARVTSAAPTYFKPVKYNGQLFVDGGMVANNPTELAVFEAKKLWPDREIGLILSLGTGKPPEVDGSEHILSVLSHSINICTDSENTHTKMIDLVRLIKPEPAYFRFSPGNGAGDYELDESNPEKWKAMQDATKYYMNEQEVKAEVEKLRKLLQVDTEQSDNQGGSEKAEEPLKEPKAIEVQSS